jgi:glucose/arabinose dehydrogenase
VGYKVTFVPFADGKPSGQPVDFLAGFVSDDGKAWGRPVGVAIDKAGAVLVADDVGNSRNTPARCCCSTWTKRTACCPGSSPSSGPT